MRIYHYTSVESLALILKTRKLRFTRLDRVDDVREAQRHIGIQFGQYFFVSCWTKEPLESIPQWNMYSKEMQGVRIDFPQYPFQSVSMKPTRDVGMEITGDALGPLTFEEMLGPEHFVLPLFAQGSHFAGDVQYVEDVEAVYRSSITTTPGSYGRANVQIASLPTLARYKSSDWQFQKEYRFVLTVIPIPKINSDGFTNRNLGQALDNFPAAFMNNVDPGIEYIDVPLADDAFKSLTIRTGPLCPLGSQVCVQALVSSLAPDAKIEKSQLWGAIRGKR
jgi:Protein of unknown function (DUF2971)